MALEILSSLASSLLSFLSSLGYPGIFILMVIESSIIHAIFPIPAEVIIFPLGILASQGELSFTFSFISAVMGALVGALINYYLAFYLGRVGLEKLFARSPRLRAIYSSTEQRAEHYFANHGSITTFVGRLIPGLRAIISLPAGFARMNVLLFSLFTLAGSAIWIFLLMYLGFIIGNSSLSQENIRLLTYFVLGGAIIIVAGYIIWKYRKNTKSIHYS